MIENELKRKFPSIQFHHINTSKIDISDREGFHRFARASIHNLAHVGYNSSVVSKEGTEQTHMQKRALAIGRPITPIRSVVEVRELQRARRRVNKAWADVLATNKALPTNLRGRHSR